MKKRFFSILFISFFWTATVFAHGTVIQTTFYSNALHQQRSIQVYLPEGYSPGGFYPVIYYLHGAFNGPYGTPNVPAILDTLIGNPDPQLAIQPVIFVRPDGNAGQFGGSAWVNSGLYGAFEDYIVQDVPNYIETTYPGAASQPDFRAIMGHSMGGQGAMHAAFTHHEFYRAVASLSGVLDYQSFSSWVPIVNDENGGTPPYTYNPNLGVFTKLLFLYSGAHSWNLSRPPYYVDFLLTPSGTINPTVMEQWLAFDPSTLAASVPPTTDLQIYFDCGTNDELLFYPFNTAFAAALDAQGLNYDFESFPGTHTSHLNSRVQIALQFINNAFSTSAAVGDGFPVRKGASLRQNAPNPFGSTTSIRFNLDRDNQVNLDVFDVRGRQVANVLYGKMKRGDHVVNWEPGDVPNGTYFYRLKTATGDTETRKLTIAK